MYVSTNLGQIDTTATNDSTDSTETIRATAELAKAIAEPASQAYAEHVRAEVNQARPAPPDDNFAIGGIALLIILYLLLFKS